MDVNGVYKPTYITGGQHPVGMLPTIYDLGVSEK
jgi:hypothetical protein